MSGRKLEKIQRGISEEIVGNPGEIPCEILGSTQTENIPREIPAEISSEALEDI